MTIVAILSEPFLQRFHLLSQSTLLLSQLLNQGVLLPKQPLLLLDDFVTLSQMLSQCLILLSQMNEFFFKRHALTLLGWLPFGKSPTNPIVFTSVLIAYQERN